MFWTNDDDARLQSLRASDIDWTYDQLAKALTTPERSFTADAVRNRLRRRGVSAPAQDPTTPPPVSDAQLLAEVAARLHARGIDFRVEGGRVVTGQPERDKEVTFDLGKEHIRMGLVSDTHGGSKFEQLSALKQFYREADEREVDFFIHAGDVTQGSDRMHRGMELEVHAHGSDAQVDYVAGTYPKSERDVRTYIIGGNHDNSFLNDGGMNVVRQIAGKRPDFYYAGQDAAYLTIGNLRTYVVHPDGGGGYAKSYRAQKIAESLPIERDISLLLVGHYHRYGAFREKRTHTFMLPCFQSQYAWLARKALYPDIGGLIVDLWLDDNGRVARVAHELLSFPAIENDWDRDVSHEVGRAWSSEGR